MNTWVIVYRLAWVLLIGLAVVGLTFVFMPKCANYRDLQRKYAAMQEETRLVEAAVRKSQTQQDRVQWDRAFVERIAREEGMAKPGETVFKVTHDAPAVAPVAKK